MLSADRWHFAPSGVAQAAPMPYRDVIHARESSMPLSRRSLFAATAAATILPVGLSRAQTRPVVRIGVMNDMSGPYRDVNDPTSAACAKQAVQEFAAGAFDVDVLSADH